MSSLNNRIAAANEGGSSGIGLPTAKRFAEEGGSKHRFGGADSPPV
jgi:NAD(P)-dependent dehydrogenase (short-subunit alcohol dehydrogenase family)